MASVVSIERLLRGSDSAAAQRERKSSRLLIAFVSAGLCFMLLPGTFLGVWNLFSITSHHSSEAISAAWLQAHGHAQVFGWIGCFLLGIGFHSAPKMIGAGALDVSGRALFTLFAWTLGVLSRWFANIYLWHWRILLPASALLELVAFLVFFASVSRHKPAGKSASRFERWILVVIAGSLGWLATLLMNFFGCISVALHANSPAFPARLDQRFLVLMGWGFIVPHVWGFSAKWLPIFLGLGPVRERALLAAVVLNVCGVVAAVGGAISLGVLVLTLAAVIAVIALRVFESPERASKTQGVHASFPTFVRFAYVWLLIAALLGIWAAHSSTAGGIWGASRHALTVGFISAMVFAIGQRVLPAFSGMKMLWSPRLMLGNCALLALGCTLRVASEVIAYQGFSARAWALLPVSAVLEMAAVTFFAVNLVLSFVQSPAHAIRLREEAAVNARTAVS